MRISDDLERRQLLRSLAGLGIAAVPLTASASAGDIQDAAHPAGETLHASRLDSLAAVVERNIVQFQMVRDFEIDESVVPAPVFIPR
jgi:hypothetical protein